MSHQKILTVFAFAALGTASLALDSKPPQWLPEKGFRLTGEDRYIKIFSHAGQHECTGADDKFTRTKCLDTEDFKLSMTFDEPCGGCFPSDFPTKYQTVFCSEKPVNGRVYEQRVLYEDHLCQNVSSSQPHKLFSDASSPTQCMDGNPHDGGVISSCSPQCFDAEYREGRCSHTHSSNRAACQSDKYCEWREAPFLLSFYAHYREFSPQAHSFGYVCTDNQCMRSATSNVSYSTCLEICRRPVMV